MNCPHCHHLLPGFIIPSFNNRKQSCPSCMKYAPPLKTEAQEIREFIMNAARKANRKKAQAAAKAAKVEYKLLKEDAKRYMVEGVEDGIYKVEVGPGIFVNINTRIKSETAKVKEAATILIGHMDVTPILVEYAKRIADKIEIIDCNINRRKDNDNTTD